jgi:hypothetical protein
LQTYSPLCSRTGFREQSFLPGYRRKAAGQEFEPDRQIVRSLDTIKAP